MNPTTVNKKTFIFLWALCILGGWSIVPYMQHLGLLPSTVPISKIVLLVTFQLFCFYGLICWISFKILPKTDLYPFQPLHKSRIIKKIALPALISGVLLGFVIFASERTIFNKSVLLGVHPPVWMGLLGSLYGSINEEVLLRLFLFTLVYFLMGKCLTIRQSNRLAILWSVNVFVALIFGVGHLPAAFKLIQPSAFEISRVLFLNGIAGIVFGWLYWSRGIWTAMAAHFVADIMIHVLFI